MVSVSFLLMLYTCWMEVLSMTISEMGRLPNVVSSSKQEVRDVVNRAIANIFFSFIAECILSDYSSVYLHCKRVGEIKGKVGVFVQNHFPVGRVVEVLIHGLVDVLLEDGAILVWVAVFYVLQIFALELHHFLVGLGLDGFNGMEIFYHFDELIRMPYSKGTE